MPEFTINKSVLLTDISWYINRYRHSTPGIYVCLQVPVVLDPDHRFVPGLIAMVNHGRLKQCEPQVTHFSGPPNFVLDVFDSSELEEYATRKKAFERFGVTEYVAIVTGEVTKCEWNRNNDSQFESIAPDENGVIKSKALPGLWFSTSPLENPDEWALGTQIEEGMSRLGHHELMETIFHKEGRKPEWGDWMPFDAG